ncbi:nitrile hydratase subunit beta (Nitrilase) (NHase) [Bordetella ansorpii]|uniref:Nitrile hydratase subunit beta n=1 Tax=Bordetella ansorpii TaxID=288768 RepID=A0A157SSY6_9BORD|nr:nitrile hydratase subunit beta [Bordetella ansorpii]SAI73539.1 nitrile hydratase subunit beta (Nitrilase) (NHase) [Bordetella ansorpii]
MDGIHDLGGRQGFDSVHAGNTEAFHAFWEKKINAINGRMVGSHIYNMDEYRHAIERMDPRHYINASYYERVFTAVATLLVEKGVIEASELNALAGEQIPLARPSKSGRIAEPELPTLEIGDRVRVREDYVGGHVRMPAYIRGKIGRIVGMSPLYPFPDAAAHGLSSPRQCTFDVRFESQELWPEAAENAQVHVSVFHGYLERAPA